MEDSELLILIAQTFALLSGVAAVVVTLGQTYLSWMMSKSAMDAVGAILTAQQEASRIKARLSPSGPS